MSLADDIGDEDVLGLPAPMRCDDCGLDYNAEREADLSECPRCDSPEVVGFRVAVGRIRSDGTTVMPGERGYEHAASTVEAIR